MVLRGRREGVIEAPHLGRPALDEVEEVVVVREDPLIRVEIAEPRPAAKEIAEEDNAKEDPEEPQGAGVNTKVMIPKRFQHVSPLRGTCIHRCSQWWAPWASGGAGCAPSRDR